MLRSAFHETPGFHALHCADDITFAQYGNKIYIDRMGRDTSIRDAAMRHLGTIGGGVQAALRKRAVSESPARPPGQGTGMAGLLANYARAGLPGAKTGLGVGRRL
jgi:hypothetical protein